jgi:hypothetical protein
MPACDCISAIGRDDSAVAGSSSPSARITNFSTIALARIRMRDAAKHIQETEQQLEEVAGRGRSRLILVADLNGPTMMARIGVMRALNRYVE